MITARSQMIDPLKLFFMTRKLRIMAFPLRCWRISWRTWLDGPAEGEALWEDHAFRKPCNGL